MVGRWTDKQMEPHANSARNGSDPRPDCTLPTQRACWQLGRQLGLFVAELGSGAAPSPGLNAERAACEPIARYLEVNVPDISWLALTPDEAIPAALLCYCEQPRTGAPAIGVVLSEQIVCAHGMTAGAAYDAGFFSTVLLFAYPNNGGFASFPPPLRALIEGALGRAINGAARLAIPGRISAALLESIQSNAPFSRVAPIARAFLDIVDERYADAADGLEEVTADLSQKTYEAIWPAITDMFPRLKLTEQYLERNTPDDWLFEMYGGRSNRTGLKVWIEERPYKGAVHRLVIIVWVLPNERAADRFLLHGETELSERLTAQQPWRATDDGRMRIYGGVSPLVMALGLGGDYVNYLSLVRHAHVVIKAYAANFEKHGGLTLDVAAQLVTKLDAHVRDLLS